jgi:HK97 family phage prohead protease
MENKSFTRENLSVKSEGTNLYLEGYAAVYGNVDSYKDIIQAGAFDAFLLSEEAKRVKFCFNHDIYKVIGVVEELKSDEKGLWFRAKLSNTSLGKDVAVLIEDGALSEFSIGYRTEDSIYKDDGVRVLTKLFLYEFSVVSRAANPKAVLTEAERKDEQPEEVAISEMSYTQLKGELEKLDGRKAEIKARMCALVLEKVNINKLN